MYLPRAELATFSFDYFSDPHIEIQPLVPAPTSTYLAQHQKNRKSLQFYMDKYENDWHNTREITGGDWQKLMESESEWLLSFYTQDKILFWL